MPSYEVIDELHMRLYEACKLRNWNLIHTSSHPENTRTFIVWTNGRRAKVVVTDYKIVNFIDADVTLTRDSLTTTAEFVADTIAANMK